MTTYMPNYPTTGTINNANPMPEETDSSNSDNKIASLDPNDAYRKTQSQIYSLQETILDSSRDARLTPKSTSPHLINGETNNVSKSSVSSTHYLTKPTVDSIPILQYVRDKYGDSPILIGEIDYMPNKTGNFIKYSNNEEDINISNNNIELPFPYNFECQYTPRPFLPSFTREYVNKLIKIKISSNNIANFLNENSRRFQNNEIWGTDIYTDDSDPLLVLKHVGFFDETDSKDSKRRTSANLNSPDNVIGNPHISIKYDLEVTVLLLDCLQAYVGINRYQINARSWRGDAPHDGLSYGIYEIKVKHPTEKVDITEWKKQ